MHFITSLSTRQFITSLNTMHSLTALGMVLITACAIGVFICTMHLVSGLLDAARASMRPFGCCGARFATFIELMEHISKDHKCSIQLPFASTDEVAFTTIPVAGSHICCSTRLHSLGGLFDHITQVHHTLIIRCAGPNKNHSVDYTRRPTAKKSCGGMKPMTLQQQARARQTTNWKSGMSLQKFMKED